ncbi:MFS general substrate transporter [Amniculicola lignicola CBS 123094]|uniref:MFS general substrate transporter n=1 Tax=Amniculicola lignicola CBS 123094 TaxID=1392246 RepID=A0A6A5X507_9PLEO|nr:MFS general substrate transporter [Amniculicola lignicola CBS 123094]
MATAKVDNSFPANAGVGDGKLHISASDDKIEDIGEKDHGFTDAQLEANHAEIQEAEAARVLKKVDFRLVPMLALLYLVAFVDRSNIGNAKIAGMVKDLHMEQGLKYNTAVTLFFVPYVLLEIPSNIVLKLMRPSRWIAILMFSWGLVMTLMGLISSYKGLLAARWFLGVTESGFFPAASFLLFYVAASLSGAFSGLLAYGIQQLDGRSGLAGWQWIFLIEGLVPIALSLIIWKILPDSPESASFLSQEERDFLVRRLADETGSGHGKVTNQDKIQKHHIIAGLSDWKVYAGVVVFWGNTVGQILVFFGPMCFKTGLLEVDVETPILSKTVVEHQDLGKQYLLAEFPSVKTVPTVINGLGYSSTNAQLLTIPIYVFASIVTIIFAWLSDYKKTRSPFIIAGYCIASVGFIAQLAIPHPKYPGLTYGFLFPVAAGLYCPFICLVSWIANSLAPSSKRAVGMALLIAAGNCGGIMGSNIYLAREAPKYQTGFGVSLGMCCSAIAMTFVLRWAYNRENMKRDALYAGLSETEIRAKFTDQEMLDLGDRNPFWRYTL